jgi:hypothetical protein
VPQGGSGRVRKTSPHFLRVTYKNRRNTNSPSKRISEPLDGTKTALNFFCTAYPALKLDKVRLFENTKTVIVLSSERTPSDGNDSNTTM